MINLICSEKTNNSKCPFNVYIISKLKLYRIRPNYSTVRLDFSKLLNKLVVKYHLIRAHFKERSAESVLNDAFAILFSDFLIKTYVVGTRLNCLDLSRQFK